MLADGKVVKDLSCGSHDTVALIERDMITITYKQQTNFLPLHNYPTVGELLNKLAKFYHSKVEEFFLVDETKCELSHNEALKDLKMFNKSFQLVKKSSLYDYASETLLLTTPSDLTKIDSDAIPLVKVLFLSFPSQASIYLAEHREEH